MALGGYGMRKKKNFYYKPVQHNLRVTICSSQRSHDLVHICDVGSPERITSITATMYLIIYWCIALKNHLVFLCLCKNTPVP